MSDCPVKVQAQINRLMQELKTRLARNLLGIYFHGSLATNCFNPLRSDLDLLVVTRLGMSLETKREIAESLLENSRRPSPIEISFLRREDLSPWRHPTPFDFHYSEDWRARFERDLADGNWETWNDVQHCDDDLAAHITVTNHRGLCLYGLPKTDVFPNVPEQDFAASILGDIQSANFGLNVILQFPVYVVFRSTDNLLTTKICTFCFWMKNCRKTNANFSFQTITRTNNLPLEIERYFVFCASGFWTVCSAKIILAKNSKRPRPRETGEPSTKLQNFEVCGLRLNKKPFVERMFIFNTYSRCV